MRNFIRNLFERIKNGINSSKIPSIRHATSRPTTPAEFQKEAIAARELLKKDAQMKIARLLRKQ